MEAQLFSISGQKDEIVKEKRKSEKKIETLI
jgi:hypothetical protein